MPYSSRDVWVTDQDELAALPGNQEDTLADRPNHLFIHPRNFTKANSPRTIKAKALALAIIKQLNLALTDLATEQKNRRCMRKWPTWKFSYLLAFLCVFE